MLPALAVSSRSGSRPAVVPSWALPFRRARSLGAVVFPVLLIAPLIFAMVGMFVVLFFLIPTYAIMQGT